jgi:hypothetical protein
MPICGAVLIETDRALRGGSWNNNANNARCANRNNNHPDNRNNNIGFRVAVSTSFAPRPEMRRGKLLHRRGRFRWMKNGGVQPWPRRSFRPGEHQLPRVLALPDAGRPLCGRN